MTTAAASEQSIGWVVKDNLCKKESEIKYSQFLGERENLKIKMTGLEEGRPQKIDNISQKTSLK